MFSLKNIMAYKIVDVKAREVFGCLTNLTHNLDQETDYTGTILEEELEILHLAGKLELFEMPKIGDKCYFWNIEGGKMDSLTEGGAYISTFKKMEGSRFSDEESHFTFLFCEKVQDVSK